MWGNALNQFLTKIEGQDDDKQIYQPKMKTRPLVSMPSPKAVDQ